MSGSPIQVFISRKIFGVSGGQKNFGKFKRIYFGALRGLESILSILIGVILQVIPPQYAQVFPHRFECMTVKKKKKKKVFPHC